jgi:hypothetical protein
LVVLSRDPLANLTCRTNTVATNGVDYYRYTVSSNAYSVTFQLTSTNGNVDLYVGTNGAAPAPWPTNYFYSSTNPGITPDGVTVDTNSAPVPITPGDWFIAVVNNDTNAVTYSICVNELIPIIIPLTNGIAFTNTVLPATSGIDYYVFNVSSNAIQANFEVLNPDGNVDLFLRQGLPLPGPASFNYAGLNPGLNNEFIAVVTNGPPVPLTPGPWYLAVVNIETNNVNYAVRATEILSSSITVLTNGNGITNLIGPANSPVSASIKAYITFAT